MHLLMLLEVGTTPRLLVHCMRCCQRSCQLDTTWSLTLHSHKVLIQQAIIHVLCLVEATASDMLHIFIDREAEWEQMQEDLGQDKVDEVVNAEHRVDDGENFDFDSNLDS